MDWSKGVATPGGGVAETISQLRRTRGKNKSPTKEQVAIRLDPGVLAAFRASGRGWQTRVNTALKEWLKTGALAKPLPSAKSAKTGG
ncbi:BrnA antitoxin family protein [Sphaerotilus sp.]|uniref:BrnA antitoxin family protein n=1 Tax=Sphaerotilus sp. TaxID=2093942 RepID=UPI003DA9EB41